jgi:IS4 transposase
MIADGTVLRLRELPSKEYKARHKEQTGLKLHLLDNVTDQTVEHFSVTNEKTHGNMLFNTGWWLEGRAIFELAYFKYRRFALIDENDGLLCEPVEKERRPGGDGRITGMAWSSHSLGRQRNIRRSDNLSRKCIDVEVELEFDRRKHAGTQSRDTKQFRVVVARNEDADDYHLYITNLSQDQFHPTNLAMIYRCRWEVELLFRELKTQCELDKFDTTKKHAVETLLYAALLSLVVSRDLLSLVIEVADDGTVFPPELWAATPVARPARPPRTEGVPRLLSTAAARTVDRRRPEDPQATTDSSRTARYYHPTDRRGLAKG